MAQGAYRVQVIATRTSGVAEDVAICDFGFFHLTGATQAGFANAGAVDDTYPGLNPASSGGLGDLTSDITGWCNGVDNYQGDTLTWSRVKIYRHDGGAPTPNTPVRDTTITVTGDVVSTTAPQTAISITLMTALRRRWGRVYLPSIGSTILTNYGRIGGSSVDGLVTATRSLMDAAAGHSFYPVVFVKGGMSISAAHTVTGIRCDDVADVIRRRRYDASSHTTVSSLV